MAYEREPECIFLGTDVKKFNLNLPAF